MASEDDSFFKYFNILQVVQEFLEMSIKGWRIKKLIETQLPKVVKT
jgi:hypothetical protein